MEVFDYWGIDSKLSTIATSLCSLFVVGADTVHNFAPLFFSPWSTGGLLVVIVSVPFLWIITPSLPGLKIVVYPFSAFLFTLRSDFVSPGSMLAFLASDDSA
jgi:hypothetical protein